MPASVIGGRLIRDVRTALGWSQFELGSRVGMSQSWISEIERGRAGEVSADTIERLLAAMGGRLILDVAAPFLVDARQREPAHARCEGHVSRRMESAGWMVRSEVEVGGDRSRGWIDLLAWHPVTRVLLVIEIKTELRDLGAIERSMNWYQREAWVAARRFGWRPRRVLGCLLVLSTEVVEERLRQNRDVLARTCPMRAPALRELIAVGEVPDSWAGRGLALIDPRSHRRDWLRPARIDGRRSPAPYADYIDFVRRVA